MAYNEAVKEVAVQEPDFMRMLYSFRAENARGVELMLSIFNMVKSLKPLQEQTGKPSELKKEDSSVTGQLWSEIDRFRNCNDSYEEIYNILRNLIGS